MPEHNHETKMDEEKHIDYLRNVIMLQKREFSS